MNKKEISYFKNYSQKTANLKAQTLQCIDSKENGINKEIK